MSEQQPQPQACYGCNGEKGHMRDTSTIENGRPVTRQTWHTCQGCSGTGVQGGGI
jgi:hypothetical protein